MNMKKGKKKAWINGIFDNCTITISGAPINFTKIVYLKCVSANCRCVVPIESLTLNMN